MKYWKIPSRVAATSVFCVLAAAPAGAQQGPTADDFETLKRLMQEVISENKDLRNRVRDLEGEMTRLKATVPPPAPAPAAAPAPAPRPARAAAPALPPGALPEVDKETAADRAKARKLLEQMELGGAVETEVVWARNFRGVSGSELTLKTASFDFEVKVKDWAMASIAADWDSAADKFTLDEALITLGNPRRFPLSLQVGRSTLPFGISTGATARARIEDILTLTDPLTKEMFEMKENFALLGLKTNGLTAGVYVYNGDTNRRGPQGEKHLEHWGFVVGYGAKNDLWSADLKAGLVDSVFDSDALTAAYPGATTTGYDKGAFAVLRLGYGGFSLVGEYDTATSMQQFTQNKTLFRIRPSAWMVEGGYTTDLFGKRAYAAVGYSQSYQVAGHFAKRRLLPTLGIWLFDGFRIAVEYGFERDYSAAKGGTGRAAESITSRMTYEW